MDIKSIINNISKTLNLNEDINTKLHNIVKEENRDTLIKIDNNEIFDKLYDYNIKLDAFGKTLLVKNKDIYDKLKEDFGELEVKILIKTKDNPEKMNEIFNDIIGSIGNKISKVNNLIKERLEINEQLGGNNSLNQIKYFKNYIKYKNKYLKLKKII